MNGNWKSKWSIFMKVNSWDEECIKSSHKSKWQKTAAVIDDMQKAIPSLTHMYVKRCICSHVGKENLFRTLVALQRQGILKCVISQNCDGLHLRSGLNSTNLAELHGNMNLEMCSKCGTKYLRDFDTIGTQSHYTGRQCNKRNCRGRLRDSIIDFGEDLPQDALDKAFDHAEKADLCLVLGQSLLDLFFLIMIINFRK